MRLLITSLAAIMHRYNDEVDVTYSTGRRRPIPKFGTSEIVFGKLRRELFIPPE
jgi:hypothetical protein